MIAPPSATVETDQGLDAGEDDTLEGDGKEFSLWWLLETGIGWDVAENLPELAWLTL